MQGACEHITIWSATISETFYQAGLKAGERFYLAWDEEVQRLFVVQWQRTRWTCTCGQNGCMHRLAANQYLFEQSMKQKQS